MNKNLKRAGIIGGTLGAITAVAFASFAFFTTATHVTAEGNSGTSTALSARNVAISEPLFPGFCSDVTFTLDNPANGHDVNGIRSVVGYDFGGEPGVNTYLAMPYIEKGTPNSVLVQHGYDFQPIAAGQSRQVVLKDAICLSPNAPDSAQGKHVVVNLDFDFKTTVGTEYAG